MQPCVDSGEQRTGAELGTHGSHARGTLSGHPIGVCAPSAQSAFTECMPRVLAQTAPSRCSQCRPHACWDGLQKHLCFTQGASSAEPLGPRVHESPPGCTSPQTRQCRSQVKAEGTQAFEARRSREDERCKANQHRQISMRGGAARRQHHGPQDLGPAAGHLRFTRPRHRRCDAAEASASDAGDALGAVDRPDCLPQRVPPKRPMPISAPVLWPRPRAAKPG